MFAKPMSSVVDPWYCRGGGGGGGVGLSGRLPQLQASRFVASDLLSSLSPFLERPTEEHHNRRVTKRCSSSSVAEIRAIIGLLLLQSPPTLSFPVARNKERRACRATGSAREMTMPKWKPSCHENSSSIRRRLCNLTLFSATCETPFFPSVNYVCASSG